MDTWMHTNCHSACGTTSDTMAQIHYGENQAVICDPWTRIVHIIYCDWDTSDSELTEEKLTELGYDLSNVLWTT